MRIIETNFNKHAAFRQISCYLQIITKVGVDLNSSYSNHTFLGIIFKDVADAVGSLTNNKNRLGTFNNNCLLPKKQIQKRYLYKGVLKFTQHLNFALFVG